MKILERYIDKLKKNKIIVNGVYESDEYYAISVMKENDIEEIIIKIYKSKEICISQQDSVSDLRIICEDLFYDLKNKESYKNYIGTDESGKGDYFGPLVVTGFLYDDSIRKELYSLDVRDSKRLNDNKNIAIGNILLDKYKERIYVFSLEPEEYNRVYSKNRVEGKNLNNILAWMHSVVIEKLNSDRYIVDQFSNKETVNDEILYEKREKTIQIFSAESMIGVAAASVISRCIFLKWLSEKTKEYGIELHKGANQRVVKDAINLSKKYSKSILKKSCKLHFKTTRKILEELK